MDMETKAVTNLLMDLVSMHPERLSTALNYFQEDVARFGDPKNITNANARPKFWSSIEILLMNKWITFVDSNTKLAVSQEDALAIIHRRIIVPSGDVFYRLTTKGGKAWEETFCPNWKLFCNTKQRMFDNSQYLTTLQCGSEEVRGGLFCYYAESVIDPEFGMRKLKFYVKESWKPVYWKNRMNKVTFCVRFMMREIDSPVANEIGMSMQKFLRPWGRSWPSSG
jgi:hypothetical protein